MAIDRTIVSLAILKVNWDRKHSDYIENFVPFIATLASNKKYEQIKLEEICEDFNEEFGIKIPHEPMATILGRCRKRGLINKEYKGYFPIWEEIAKHDFSEGKNEQEKRLNKVVGNIQEYVKSTFEDDIEKEEIENALIDYFREHDIDILFAAYKRHTLLPKVKAKRRKKYYVFKYIKECCDKEPEIFGYIVDLAIGHVLANTIMYDRDYRNFQGGLKKLTVYLDIKFLLRLSGVEGNMRKENVLDFLDGLIEKGSRCKVFEHTFDETLGILSECKRWINKKGYDKRKASPATQYFVEYGRTESDVDLCISQLRTLLMDRKIDVEPAPDRSELSRYLISEEALNEKIVGVYKEENPYFKEEEKEVTIGKDITSISSIYLLRKNEKPRYIRDAGYIFVTANGSLARAAKRFEREVYGKVNVIPACITHILLGTTIWLDNPVKMTEFSRKRIIADCIAALKPDRALIKLYLQEVEKLNKEKKITDEEYYYLKAHKSAYDLLGDKTYGDAENFTDKTSHEIADEIKAKVKAEGDKLLDAEKKAHLGTQTELEGAVGRVSKFERNAWQVAVVGAIVVAGIAALIVLTGVVLGVLSQVIPDSFNLEWRRGFIGIGAVFTLLSLGVGFDVKGMRKWLYLKVRDYILKILLG